MILIKNISYRNLNVVVICITIFCILLLNIRTEEGIKFKTKYPECNKDNSQQSIESTKYKTTVYSPSKFDIDIRPQTWFFCD